MKKILALALALLLLVGATVSFTSCGEKETTTNTETNDAQNIPNDVTDNILVCGVTIIPGLNEKDATGNWTGFETEFAEAVGAILGMKVVFQEIDWSQKYNELNSGAIDCVWNGFTANSSDKDPAGNSIKRSDLVDFSYGYMLNQQCVVVKKTRVGEFTSAAALNGKTACVEGGSAGAAYAAEVTSPDKISNADSQIKAFPEVKSGAVDFIVVDILLAQNMCGKGDYEDLTIVDAIQLPSEIYAVGFKKGSDLTAKVNAAIKELEANGKLAELARKYGFENVLKITETIE